MKQVFVIFALMVCVLAPLAHADSVEKIAVYNNKSNELFIFCFQDRLITKKSAFYTTPIESPCFSLQKQWKENVRDAGKKDIVNELKRAFPGNSDIAMSDNQWMKIKCEYFKWAGDSSDCKSNIDGIQISDVNTDGLLRKF